MKLSEGEQILRIFHHHPTPFFFDIFKVILGSFPFMFLIFLFKATMSDSVFLISNIVLLVIFSLVIIYVSLIYWLDKLVITNLRIVNVDWKYLTVRNEAEAMLVDIQDILTYEKGWLAYFKAFDYGTLKLDTSSSYTTLEFFDAPSPEEIRRFIYHVRNQ